MRLIDADLLYKAMQDAEELARQRVLDTECTLPYPNNLNPSYTRYLAQMSERTKAKEMVADAPTVDAVPIRHGRWKTVEDWDGDEHYQCSVCGAEFVLIDGDPDDNDYLYCPHCGAKMNEEGR